MPNPPISAAPSSDVIALHSPRLLLRSMTLVDWQLCYALHQDLAVNAYVCDALSEALHCLLQFALQHCGYHKLLATFTSGNEPSLKLLQKHGFVQEDLLREHFWLGGRFVDDLKLGLLSRDWPGHQR